MTMHAIVERIRVENDACYKATKINVNIKWTIHRFNHK